MPETSMPVDSVRQSVRFSPVAELKYRHNTSHQKKIMATTWWPSADLIHCRFLKPGETIIADKYCNEFDESSRK
ncbi:hypothetical protein TNCV_4976791 [Trichonephila clavipes]|nr:hypothetical protein TNCV_4976791 [Trichonephila clavipes]